MIGEDQSFGFDPSGFSHRANITFIVNHHFLVKTKRKRAYSLNGTTTFFRTTFSRTIQIVTLDNIATFCLVLFW
jgi:hypothetical protein